MPESPSYALRNWGSTLSGVRWGITNLLAVAKICSALGISLTHNTLFFAYSLAASPQAFSHSPQWRYQHLLIPLPFTMLSIPVSSLKIKWIVTHTHTHRK